MSVQLTTAKLFELLGSAYAEARMLTEEVAKLNAENQALKAMAAPPEKPQRKAK